MIQYYIQEKGKLVPYDDQEWISNHHLYRYGHIKDYIYESLSTPTCNICGSLLIFQKKSKYLNIIKCSNNDCISNCGKGDFKLQAFLPSNMFEQIKKERIHKGIFDKESIMSKGYTEKEAEDIIQKRKENISKANKNHNAQYFINKIGKDEYYKQLRNRNHLCIEYWLNKGYTEKQAKEEISKIQSKNNKLVKNHVKINYDYIKNNISDDPKLFFKKRSCFTVEHWINKGYSEEEAKNKVSIK